MADEFGGPCGLVANETVVMRCVEDLHKVHLTCSPVQCNEKPRLLIWNRAVFVYRWVFSWMTGADMGVEILGINITK